MVEEGEVQRRLLKPREADLGGDEHGGNALGSALVTNTRGREGSRIGRGRSWAAEQSQQRPQKFHGVALKCPKSG